MSTPEKRKRNLSEDDEEKEENDIIEDEEKKVSKLKTNKESKIKKKKIKKKERKSIESKKKNIVSGEEDTSEIEIEEKSLQFDEMGLDDRLLEGIAKLGWTKPTLIQEKAIPLALKGKDIFAKARTGSGKTGAFVIPLIHKILEDKTKDVEQVTKAFILTPTKELCRQTSQQIKSLTMLCNREVRCVDVSTSESVNVHRPLLTDKPDIVVGTPTRILSLITENIIEVKDIKEHLKFVIIDEADLLFTFEYSEDLMNLIEHLPSICQTFLTSATLGDEVRKLKSLVLRKPVILKLEEPPLPNYIQLQHYVMEVNDFQKAFVLYTIFRLKLLGGKSIIFVNTIDKGYKLRLFLAQFGIRSCVLNSHLPVASRCHVIDEFNLGKYTVLIASDETVAQKAEVKPKKKRKKKYMDEESGASRGIDFQFVSNVVNFDFPHNVDCYVHHVGRTARGNYSGKALSFVAVNEKKLFEEVKKGLHENYFDPKDPGFRKFEFDLKSADGFRYRADDVWRQCTSIAVKDARRIELKQEVLNSVKLQNYFEEHPRDLEAIRHDIVGKGLHTEKHLRGVPAYNIPHTFKKHADKISAIKHAQKHGRNIGDVKKKQYLKREEDPLKSLRFGGFKKKIKKVKK